MTTNNSLGQAINRRSNELLNHNVRMNSLKALLYCCGLSASRYIEYSLVLIFLLPRMEQDCTVLEVGCGHSIIPTFWQRLGVRTVILDSSSEGLKWQMRKSRKLSNSLADAVLADMRYLPFKDGSICRVSCISAIEHVPADGDIEAASDIGRVLKNDGELVVSFPLSLQSKSHSRDCRASGIPPLMQGIFGKLLPTIFKKFGVDRTDSYFERFFSYSDVQKRIVVPSKCIMKDYFTLKSVRRTKFLHQRLFPTGVLTILEYFIAHFLVVSKEKDADAIVLKLGK